MTWIGAARGQLCDEVGVLGRGQALVERGDQAIHVVCEERVGIEPESREDLGADTPSGPGGMGSQRSSRRTNHCDETTPPISSALVSGGMASYRA
jgi:hypothetical protein